MLLMLEMSELKSNYCAGQQSEHSCRIRSFYSGFWKLRNGFLLSFVLLVLVWIKTESCARTLPQNFFVCQFLDARIERGRERESGRENEWVVKVRVSWGRRERNCFHYKETEWRFYGCEISQAVPYSSRKYRLQRSWSVEQREDKIVQRL